MVQAKAKLLLSKLELLKLGSGFYPSPNCPERISDRSVPFLVVWDARSSFRILSIFNCWKP